MSSAVIAHERGGSVIADAWVLAGRVLRGYLRVPQSLFFSFIQPVMFVLLFRYVFGGSLGVITARLGVPYVDFLMPGILVQTIIFGAAATSVGLAEDLASGIMERFRALPISRAAVLLGRTAADLVRNLATAVIVVVVGLAVGFRPHHLVGLVVGLVVVLAFSYALSWLFAIVGLYAPSAEAAQLMSFPVLFPLTFVSSAFVPIQTLPGWLQGFARYQPVSLVMDAARLEIVGSGARALVGVSLGASLLGSLAVAVGFVIVAAPIAIRRFSRMT
ncbi:ABC-2 type transporter [Acidimicrobium ferrooxidans DSM 10331]|uniref:Transport permease protein n=1 Tax=Acidimicrobium ferrooxidans (strain DSM 10331 / JCM 15462 / NBRC 103882 / ICP) TaxID=525909 RepID=C7M1P2_ACIFD|nr:ABC transporter permease [Acidimicrobium ferrooxidans]ACU54789.1 ABC-2 type transporter [Acidimicrobium ferrooxidans DSM 10331]